MVEIRLHCGILRPPRNHDRRNFCVHKTKSVFQHRAEATLWSLPPLKVKAAILDFFEPSRHCNGLEQVLDKIQGSSRRGGTVFVVVFLLFCAKWKVWRHTARGNTLLSKKTMSESFGLKNCNISCIYSLFRSNICGLMDLYTVHNHIGYLFVENEARGTSLWGDEVCTASSCGLLCQSSHHSTCSRTKFMWKI